MGHIKLRTKGFTLIELLVVIAIIALLVSILLPALASARDAARALIARLNVKQFTIATLNYSTDNKEVLSGFVPPEPFNGQYLLKQYNGPGIPDTVASYGDEVTWMSYRGYDLIRRLSTPFTNLAGVPNWLPQINYSHLPLVEYMAKRLPEPVVITPNDFKRKQWADNPGTPVAGTDRGPFSSSFSYSIHATFLDRDGAPNGSIRQATTIGTFFVTPTPSWRMSRRKASEITFPGRKVAWVEQFALHTGKKRQIPAYFMNDQAEPVASFFDGSARFIRTREAVSGAYTLSVGINIPTAGLQYTSDSVLEELPWTNGNNSYSGTELRGAIRWTPGGLKGWDFIGAP